jgi:serine/threonine protein kinase
MSATVPIATLLPGLQVYKYKLQRRIGFGGFGEVWLANDNAVGHDYAIKILKPGMPVHERLREAHIGHSLMHSNLVRVHQADVVSLGGHDLVIIAMDYLPDGAITKLANPSGFLPLPEAIRIGTDIMRGLEYLHGQNFFHNDVKPENVLIGPQAQGMLTDYGDCRDFGGRIAGATAEQLQNSHCARGREQQRHYRPDRRVSGRDDAVQNARRAQLTAGKIYEDGRAAILSGDL